MISTYIYVLVLAFMLSLVALYLSYRPFPIRPVRLSI
jgi:hypothetical protein